jgi:hypothetical protein
MNKEAKKQSGHSYARHRASELSRRSRSTAYIATSSASSTTSSSTSTTKRECVDRGASGLEQAVCVWGGVCV